MFERQLDIGMAQVDAAGVVFGPRLLELAHGVYEAFLAEHGWSISRILDEGWALPIVHMEADFALPLRLDDRVSVTLSVERLGKSSFTLGYRFSKAGEDGGLAASARSVHVATDGSSKRALPADLAALLSTAIDTA